VSWYRPHLEISLEMIRRFAPSPHTSIRELKYRGLHRQLFCLPWPRSVHRQVRNGAVEVKLYLTVLRLARQRLARTSVHVY
jgi:hypothetical protein